jgi:hypothetical protein
MEEKETVLYCEACQTVGGCCGKEKEIGWTEVTKDEPTE